MLNDRKRRYFNHSHLSSSKRGASLICKALLKYGYVGFRLEILEYCPSSIILSREQFYIDKLNPEYGRLKKISLAKPGHVCLLTGGKDLFFLS